MVQNTIHYLVVPPSNGRTRIIEQHASRITGKITFPDPSKKPKGVKAIEIHFVSVITPDLVEHPLVAHFVAHGGVVHARRGLKDIPVSTPLYSNHQPPFSKPNRGWHHVVYAGSVSKVEGTAIKPNTYPMIGSSSNFTSLMPPSSYLLAPRGTKIDLHPGDEVKIELGEDMRVVMN